MNIAYRRILLGLATLGATGAATLLKGMSNVNDFRVDVVEIPLLEPGVLRESDSFDILHIADLHMLPSQTIKQRFVSRLVQLRPDLVINTGDNLGDPRSVPYVMQSLTELLNIPGMFVFGTNDYFAPRPVNPFGYLLGKKRKPSSVPLPWRDMRAAFVERGWHDATHSRVEVQVGDVRLAVTGVDDPHHDLDNYDLVAGRPNKDADLSIALTHSPEPRVLRRFAADGYQLSISGHTHGGQICLPGGRAVVTNCGIDRARAHGLHQFDSMAMYVSRGLGTSKFAPVRLNCPPTATLLRITEKPTDTPEQ